GLLSPLHFFPDSSWEYAELVLLKNKPEDVALYTARKKWSGDDFSLVPGESLDPYNSLCFRSIDPLGEEFKLNSIEVFEPIITNMERMEKSE
ncbi:MAG TPA: hypothetical protein VHP36_01325, partial [Chitinispirillaceae bacterium]|nr:hypothetical protein [Chitinispirillaceae bacterium]